MGEEIEKDQVESLCSQLIGQKDWPEKDLLLRKKDQSHAMAMVGQVVVWAQGWPVWGERCVFGCGLKRLVSHHIEGEPRPRGSRSPVGRTDGVFINRPPMLAVSVAFFDRPLGWSHSPDPGPIQKPFPSGPLFFGISFEWRGTLRLPNHVGLSELKPQVPGQPIQVDGVSAPWEALE